MNEILAKLRELEQKLEILRIHGKIDEKNIEHIEPYVGPVTCPFIDKDFEFPELPDLVGCEYAKSLSCQGKIPGKFMTCDAYRDTLTNFLLRLNESGRPPKVIYIL